MTYANYENKRLLVGAIPLWFPLYLEFLRKFIENWYKLAISQETNNKVINYLNIFYVCLDPYFRKITSYITEFSFIIAKTEFISPFLHTTSIQLT